MVRSKSEPPVCRAVDTLFFRLDAEVRSRLVRVIRGRRSGRLLRSAPAIRLAVQAIRRVSLAPDAHLFQQAHTAARVEPKRSSMGRQLAWARSGVNLAREAVSVASRLSVMAVTPALCQVPVNTCSPDAYRAPRYSPGRPPAPVACGASSARAVEVSVTSACPSGLKLFQNVLKVSRSTSHQA